MKRCLLVTLLLTAGCGEERSSSDLKVNIPWTAATGHCTDISADLQRLTAVVEISGHTACPLSIGANLAAYGTCPDITPKAVRHVAVIYTVQPQIAGTAEPIALHVSTIDLTEGAIGDSEDISLALVNDGVRGRLVRTEADVAALPASSNQNLRNAEQWLADLYTERDYSLDADDDNCSNIDEACNDTLYDANNTSCAQ